MEYDRRQLRRAASTLTGLVLLAATATAAADTALIAVATNFAEVMEKLERDFEAQSPHAITVSAGSTGKLYAQIVAGAPFDVLLAADQERPDRLEAEGMAVRGTRFTYATGRLALWSPDPQRVAADGAAVLRTGDFRRLAIANPDLAPYGAAAIEVLDALGVADTLADRLVMGENIGQTHAMVATGNAEVGLVALSSVISPRTPAGSSYWVVPDNLHSPIRQDVILLTRAEDNSAARDLLAYLRRPEVREVIRQFGYGVE